ncbi:MAG: SDR family oxidoreductase [Phycisphaerae bacterium]|jgi:3-oxoacyl-[acyl-carrier protein] reductase
MNLDLSGKSALVCGASGGIGLACAAELAGLGADVTIAARDVARLAAAVSTLPKVRPGQSHATLVLDTSDAAKALAAVEANLAARGSGYHVLINNTGGPPGGTMADSTATQLRGAFESLLVSAHAITQALVPGMKAARYGRIINISSTSVKQPIAGLGLSNAVRAAVSNWGKSLSQELGRHGITVNSVLPGYTETDRLAELFKAKAARTGQSIDAVTAEAVASIPAGRLGAASEIAAVVAFLASPAAAYVNGVQVPVDGGRLGCL